MSACNCNVQCSTNVPQIDEKGPIFTESRVIEIDFGEVPTGQERITRVSIKNQTNKTRTYVVGYNNHTLSMYQFFRANTEKFVLLGGETFNLKILYKPLIAWSADYDFINILDSAGEETRVMLAGKSIAPQLQISANYVRFNTWPESVCCKKTVEIRNLSAFPVEFKFDVETTPMPFFEIVPVSGLIPEHRHVIVNISFGVAVFGEYRHRFFCMIHNHQPLMVDCFGVYWKSKIQYLEFTACNKYLRQPIIIECNYDRYMRDVQILMKEKPAFSFIGAYLNFGSIDMAKAKQMTQVTTLTNHSDRPVIAKWYPDECFKVTPTQVQIPANKSVLFECQFCPTVANEIYSRQLLVNVFCTEEKSEEDRLIPIPAILRVLGHSFGELKVLIPQFQIHPLTVILPPVLPGCTTFTTIELRSSGYFPTSFKFSSPTTSNFLVKPMMGCVSGLTIVVIQLTSVAMDKPTVYNEEWHLMLNNDRNHITPICLKGYAEYPSIEVGVNNTITIKGVQVGCEKVVSVNIQNTCHLPIYYEFMTCDLPEELEILKTKGSVATNKHETIKVRFKSTKSVCKQVTVTCLVYAMKELTQVYGSPVEVYTTIQLESDHSDLCSMPSNFDFGAVECHSSHSTKFCLFNYGRSTIHYELSLYWGHVMEYYQYATVTPACGTLEPKAHVQCCIHFSPHLTGLHSARVYYKLRPDFDTFETVENTRKHIYQFRASVIYPHFQIVSIADHNFGPLFSKRSLWEFLNLNWLNYVLAEAPDQDGTICIDLKLPDANVNNKHFYVKLMAHNVTQFPVHVSLKRRKLCDCEAQDAGVFLSIRRRVYQCPHRQMCTLSIFEKTIAPLSVQEMMLQVMYIIEGQTMLSYHLSINKKRSIVLNINLNVIGVGETCLSKYTKSYSMITSPIYLGVKQPTVHAFWFYNNTNMPVSYELDTNQFEKINMDFSFEVWKCLNPEGTVNEYKAHPLFIKYHPLQMNPVLLHIPLIISDGTLVELNIRARGTRSIIPNKIPRNYVSNIFHPNAPVHLSMDRLRIEAFPVWSETTRLILMTNMSDEILGYNWIRSEVSGLCTVEVIHPSRVLRPKQTDMIVVLVKSFYNACSTRIHLPCEIISHTKYLQHQKSLQDYNRREQEIQQEFIITDTGVAYPKNDNVILSEAEVFYTTLALDIEITSYVDRDLHFTSCEQLQQAPSNIFPESAGTLPHKQNLPSIAFLVKPQHADPLPTSSLVYNDDLYVERNPNEIDPTSDNVVFYQQVMEALLADVVLSNTFREVLNIQKNAASVYYTQIKPQEEDQTSLEKQIEAMYNEPQMTFVKDLMHDMLLQSFEEIFKLKPPTQMKDIDYRREVNLPNVCKCTMQENNRY